MIALLCAALLCLGASDSSGAAWPSDPDLARHARWRFVVYFYGRAIVVDGWESERECREMRDRMRRQYPDARITDCEESR